MLRRRLVLAAAAAPLFCAAITGPIGSTAAIGNQLPTAKPVKAELFGVAGLTPNDYWAVGARIINDGFDQRVYTEHWDGQAWRPIATPRPERSDNEVLNAVVAVKANSVWALGWAQPDFVEQAPFAEHWDGQKWKAMYLKVPEGVRDTEVWGADATSDFDLWAVGDAGNLNNVQPLAEHWNGTRWSITGLSAHEPKIGGFQAVDAISPKDVWAVGAKKADGQYLPLAEHYDGHSWTIVSVPLPRGSEQGILINVAGEAPSDLWAVGVTGTGIAHPLIEHWDGSRWRVMAANASGDDMLPRGVAVVAPDDVWVVGYNHNQKPVFLHWEGSAFQQVKADVGIEQVDAVDFTSSDDGMAVGLSSAHRAVLPAHARWDGNSWLDEG